MRTLQGSTAKRPELLGFYVGSEDARFSADNLRFDRELRAARVPHLFRLYPGGHEQALWSAHAVEWLDRALAQLTPASPPA